MVAQTTEQESPNHVVGKFSCAGRIHHRNLPSLTVGLLRQSRLQASLDTNLQFLPDAQRPKSQRTDADAQVGGDASAQIDLSALVLGVIALNQRTRERRQT